MVYPALISSFAFLVLLALITFLVPVFEKVFKDFGGELPTMTKFTVALSHAVTGRWYLFILGGIGFVFAFRYWKRSERGRLQWDSFKLRMPMKLGTLIQKIALARFSRTFSALVSAGVPMLEAIQITGRPSGNKVIENSMDAVLASVKKGGTIAQPMREEPRAFPAMVVHMVAVGEESGSLDKMLAKVADFYEDQVAAAIKALMSLLEPILIIAVGAIVGFIVIAMYLPMFQVYDQIK